MSVAPADLGTYLRAKAAGALTARAALYFPLETWRAVADTVAKLGRGDDWVWIGGREGIRRRLPGLDHRPVLRPLQRRPHDVRGVLDQDLTRIPTEAIERATVRATVVGGRVVFQAK
jgi:hypothetical protein